MLWDAIASCSNGASGFRAVGDAAPAARNHERETAYAPARLESTLVSYFRISSNQARPTGTPFRMQ